MHFAVIAEAQQAEKVFRIGYLGSSGSDPPQAFRQGLRDLGYVEGKNIIFEYRTTRGKSARYPDLAAELVRLRVDVIVGEGAGAIGAAKNASATIPIVMAHVNDPIMLGLVASLADPGGNITGHIQSITRVERQAFGVDQSSAPGVTCGIKLSILDNLPRVAPPASSMFRTNGEAQD